GTLSAQRNEGGPLLSIFGDPNRPRTRNASFTKRHAASSRGRHERASRPKWAKIADRPRGHAMTEGNVKQWHGEGAVRDRLNRPVRDLRISVIDRCNYRCPYCRPADVYGDGHEFLPRAHWLTAGEIKRVASLFLRLGVTKFRLTGGEPLLRKDLVDIVAALAELPGVDDIALTTNGTLLAGRARALKAAGLKRVTVSLDSLDDATFRAMNGDRGDFATVLAAIDAARAAGFAPVKVKDRKSTR